MLPMNKKALIVYVLVIVAALIFLFLPDSASKGTKNINDSKTVNIQEWQTKNGVRVLYVFAPELPMVDMQVIFDAGSIRDGNKPGISNFANGLLSHGAKLGDEVLSVDDIAAYTSSLFNPTLFEREDHVLSALVYYGKSHLPKLIKRLKK